MFAREASPVLPAAQKVGHTKISNSVSGWASIDRDWGSIYKVSADQLTHIGHIWCSPYNFILLYLILRSGRPFAENSDHRPFCPPKMKESFTFAHALENQEFLFGGTMPLIVRCVTSIKGVGSFPSFDTRATALKQVLFKEFQKGNLVSQFDSCHKLK